MKLYDETVKKIKNLLETAENRPLLVGESAWPDVSDRSMILRSEMTYELGGENLAAAGATIVTTNQELVEKDSVMLIGEDLQEIRTDVPYARIALVRVAEDAFGEGEALYQAIRDLEYVRYRFYPEGFMMRVSSSRNRESVRVSKDALAKGLDFTKTGNRMISAFHRKKEVEAVQLYYITKRTFDYAALLRLINEAEGITKTIDHILKNALMDCKACSLQKICDEVEGLKALHFAQNRFT